MPEKAVEISGKASGIRGFWVKNLGIKPTDFIS